MVVCALAAGLALLYLPPRYGEMPSETASTAGQHDPGSPPELLAGRGAPKHQAATHVGTHLAVEVRSLSGDQPVPGASVVVRGTGQLAVRGTTNAAGVFEATGLPRIDLEIAASASDFAPSVVEVEHAALAATGRVTLHLAGGHQVVGRVVDEDGQPIAGAVVEASSGTRVGNATSPARQTETDADGVFTLADLAAGSQVLSARWPLGWKGRGRTVRVPLPTPIELVLPQGVTIEGTVTSTDTGQSLGGATVHVSNLNYSMTASTRTDERGRYTLGPLDPAAPPAYLRVTRPGYRPQTQDALVDRGLATPHPSIARRAILDLGLNAGDRITLDMALDPGAVVTGTVRGPDGPVGGAIVRPVPPRGSNWTRTNASGVYRLVGLDPRPALIAVQAPGYLQVGAVHPLPSGAIESLEAFQLMGVRPSIRAETVHDIRLERGQTLEVQVQDSQGRTLSGAKLWIRPEEGASQPHVSRSAKGIFSVSGIARRGALVIGATLEGYEAVVPEGVRVVEGTQGDVVLVRMRKRATLTVHGRMNSNAEATLRGAYVQVAWVDRSGFALDPVGRMKLWTTTKRHPVRDDGSFRVSLTGAPGRFAVRAGALGHVAAHSPDQLVRPGESDAEIDLTLATGARLQGKVLDAASGDPIRGALVRLTSTNARGGRGAMWYLTPAATDGSGAFAITELGKGTYLLEVAARKYSSGKRVVEVAATNEPVTIRLHKADGTISGIVESNAGTPLLGARIRALQGKATARAVRARADGSFLLRGLQRRKATVHAGARGHVGTRADDVAVETRDLRLILEAGVTAAGVLLDARARPLARTWIHFESRGPVREGTWVRTDEAGRFRRDGLPRGSHDVSLRVDGRRFSLGTVVLPDEDLVIRR